MLPGELTNDIIKRLNVIKGQIEGITRMLNDDKDPEKISIQFKAADQALQKAHFCCLMRFFEKVWH
nr:metal-sensitive transcriptional regulator [Elizabethkingia bruuniana]